MIDKIADLKQRLSEDTRRAKAAERAVGLIEDIVRSIEGASTLTATLDFVDGALIFRLQVEEFDGAASALDPAIHGSDPAAVGECGAENGTAIPTFIGVDMSEVEADAGYITGDWSDDEVGTCLSLMDDGAGSHDIAVALNRSLDDAVAMIRELSEPERPADPPADLPEATPPPAAKPVPKMDEVPVKAPWGVGPVSDGELARLVELWPGDLTIAQIAAKMGIKPKRVSNVASRFREKFPKREAGAHFKKSVAPPTQETTRIPPARRAPERSVPDNPTLLERQTAARLNGLEVDSRWPAENDLMLVEVLVGGKGFDVVAATLKISPHDCKARWKQLLPEITIEDQAAVMAVLRSWLPPSA